MQRMRLCLAPLSFAFSKHFVEELKKLYELKPLLEVH